MRKLIIPLWLILGLTSQVYAQAFKNTIVEVYLDNDSIETFEYSLKIISNGDTISPVIIDKYFIPTLNLDSRVTLLILYKNRKIPVPYVENIFLLGKFYIKVNISSTAVDTCVQSRFECLDMTDILITRCEDFHSVLLKRLCVYDYRDFYNEWKRKKTLEDKSNKNKHLR